MGFLIDSTLLIRAERHRHSPEQLIAEILDRWGDVQLAISVMSAGELLHGVWRADVPARRARREEFVEALLAAVPVVPISLTIIRVSAELDARLAGAGARLPTSDLLIGSTALSRGDAILTGNLRHFRRIPGVVAHEWT